MFPPVGALSCEIVSAAISVLQAIDGKLAVVENVRYTFVTKLLIFVISLKAS